MKNKPYKPELTESMLTVFVAAELMEILCWHKAHMKKLLRLLGRNRAHCYSNQGSEDFPDRVNLNMEDECRRYITVILHHMKCLKTNGTISDGWAEDMDDEDYDVTDMVNYRDMELDPKHIKHLQKGLYSDEDEED